MIQSERDDAGQHDEAGYDEVGYGAGFDEAGYDDIDLPPGGGVFRRLSAGTSLFAVDFSLAEELFAPTRHQARQELEVQRRVGRPAPSPTDPPLLPADPGPAAGARRFAGRIAVPPPAHAVPTVDAAPEGAEEA